MYAQTLYILCFFPFFSLSLSKLSIYIYILSSFNFTISKATHILTNNIMRESNRVGVQLPYIQPCTTRYTLCNVKHITSSWGFNQPLLSAAQKSFIWQQRMLIIRIRLSKRSHLRRCMHLSFVLKSKLGNLSRIKRGRIQLKFYVLNYKFASLLFSFHSHSSGILEVQLGVTCFWGVLHHKLA